MAYAEAGISAATMGTNVKENLGLADPFTPLDCVKIVDATNRNVFTVNTFTYMGHSLFPFMATVTNTGFHAVLPPNSPSCYASGASTWDGQFLNSASSYHSGGVNVVMGDGSVRFVSDTVDCGSSSNANYSTGMAGLSGKSPYGVWGAMGTVGGGETVSL